MISPVKMRLEFFRTSFNLGWPIFVILVVFTVIRNAHAETPAEINTEGDGQIDLRVLLTDKSDSLIAEGTSRFTAFFHSVTGYLLAFETAQKEYLPEHLNITIDVLDWGLSPLTRTKSLLGRLNAHDDIIAVLGTGDDDSSLEVAPLLDSFGLAQVTHTVSSPALSPFPNHFRGSASILSQCRAALSVLRSNFGADKVAMIVDDTQDSLHSARTYLAIAGEFNISIDPVVHIDPIFGTARGAHDTADLSKLFQTIKDSGAKIILMASSRKGLVATEAYKAGVRSPEYAFFMNSKISNQLAVQARRAGNLRLYDGWSGVNLGRSSKEYDAFESLFRNHLPMPEYPTVDFKNGKISPLLTLAYDAGELTFRGIARACNVPGSINCTRSGLIAAMKQVNFSGIHGVVESFSHHDFNGKSNDRKAALDVLQMQNNQAVLIGKIGLDGKLQDQVRPFRFSADSTSSGDAAGALKVPLSISTDVCVSDRHVRDSTIEEIGGNVIQVFGDCVPCPENSYNPRGDNIEACIKCKEGSHLEYIDSESASACVDEGIDLRVVLVYGLAFGLLFVIVLITALLMRHRARRAAKGAIKARESQKQGEEYVSYLFHELRNPFAAVDGTLRCTLDNLNQFLISQTNTTANGIKKDSIHTDARRSVIRTETPQDQILRQTVLDISDALNCCEHLLQVLNNVLDLSRFDNGSAQLQCVDFEINASLKALLSLIPKPENPDKLRIEYIGVQEPVWLYGDEQRLRQLLINIVSNAIKHTQEGFVQIVASIVNPSDIEPGVELKQTLIKKDDTVQILLEVRDTGSGIPAHIKDTLFEKFKIGDESSGTGLGLAISKRIASLMGSEIQVESPWSKLQNGSRFFLKINFSKGTPPPSSIVTDNIIDGPSTSIEHNLDHMNKMNVSNISLDLHDIKLPIENISCNGNSATKRVLIADDSLVNTQLLKRILERSTLLKPLKLSCTTCLSGEEAIKLITSQENHFDVVILDQNMGTNRLLGTEVVQKLKSTPQESRATASGNCTPADIEGYTKCGADLVWPKPYPAGEDILKHFQVMYQPK